MHSDALASGTWDGLGWGGSYRGEPGPMVEGGYTIKAGAQSPDDIDASWEWLSNAEKSSTEVKSVISEAGYTVEFKITLTNDSIGDYKPHANQEIGLGVKTADGAAALESFNGYAGHGPKSLSNLKLVTNPENAGTIWTVKEVRENYSITVDGAEDQPYADASVFGNLEEDGYTVKALWKDGKVYFYATLKEETTSLEIEAFGKTIVFTESGEKMIEGEMNLGDYAYLTVKVNKTVQFDASTREALIMLKENDRNIGRHLYEAKKLASGTTITVDGIKDVAYGEKVADIATVSLKENGGTPQSTGVAYIRWDDEYLYVFVEVNDADVSTEQRGDPYNNDSVEVWLDTCQKFQTGQGWGGDNRPMGLYRGEGGFRVIAGKIGADSGQHWLWDDERTRPETASVVTDTGYTVEYKIPWGKKLDGAEGWDDGFANYIPATGERVDQYADSSATTNKVGQIINIMININDDNGQDGVREGITSLNGKGCEAWAQPFVLDQLKLVAADE